jgi:type VI protein secretion system component VasA
VAAGKEVVKVETKEAGVAGIETEKEEEEDYSDDDFDDDDFEDDDEEEEEAAAAEEKKDATGTVVEKATKVEAAVSPDDGTKTALSASPAVAARALATTTADSPAGQEQPPAQPAAVDVDIVAVLRATLSLDGIPSSTACLERSSGDAEVRLLHPPATPQLCICTHAHTHTLCSLLSLSRLSLARCPRIRPTPDRVTRRAVSHVRQKRLAPRRVSTLTLFIGLL